MRINNLWKYYNNCLKHILLRKIYLMFWWVSKCTRRLYWLLKSLLQMKHFAKSLEFGILVGVEVDNPGDAFLLDSENDIEPSWSKLEELLSDKKDDDSGKELWDDGGGSNIWLGTDFCVIWLKCSRKFLAFDAPGEGGFTPNRKFSAILSIFFKFPIFIFFESMLSIMIFSFLYISSRKFRFASERRLLLLLL